MLKQPEALKEEFPGPQVGFHASVAIVVRKAPSLPRSWATAAFYSFIFTSILTSHDRSSPSHRIYGCAVSDGRMRLNTITCTSHYGSFTMSGAGYNETDGLVVQWDSAFMKLFAFDFGWVRRGIRYGAIVYGHLV